MSISSQHKNKLIQLFEAGIEFIPTDEKEFLYLACYHQFKTKNSKLAEDYMKQAMESIYISTLVELGVERKSETYHRLAKDVGTAKVFYELGKKHEEKEDIDNAKLCYQTASEMGHAASLFKLGQYSYGENDFQKAKSYYLKAIEAGYNQAWIELGDLYNYEFNDMIEAEICYKKATDFGLAIGFDRLGKIENDKELADLYYQKAVDAGHQQSLYSSFYMYRKDEEKSDFYLQKILDWGNTNLIVRVADCCGDTDKAERLYKIAIEKGHIGAMYNLGRLYERKDIKKAKQYFEKAVDNGHVNASYSLACIFHENGDTKQAKFYFKKAAKDGHVTSLNILGKFYFKRTNYVKAKYYFKQAIDVSDDAINNLARVYFKEGNIQEAKYYYQKAISDDSFDCVNELADIYIYNDYDIDKAKIVYQQAVQYDSSKYAENLVDFYLKISHNEEAFITAVKYIEKIPNEKIKICFNKLKFPISKTNRIEIYGLLETIKPPTDLSFSSDLYLILQDVMIARQDLLCKLIYQCKLQNNV